MRRRLGVAPGTDSASAFRLVSNKFVRSSYLMIVRHSGGPAVEAASIKRAICAALACRPVARSASAWARPAKWRSIRCRGGSRAYDVEYLLGPACLSTEWRRRSPAACGIARPSLRLLADVGGHANDPAPSPGSNPQTLFDLGQRVGEVHDRGPAPTAGAFGHEAAGPGRLVVPDRLDAKRPGDHLEVVTG